MSDFGALDELSPAQRRAVELLLAGKTFVRTAEELNIGRRTLHRWASMPAFKAALADAEALALAELSRGLVALARASLNTIAGILGDLSISPAVRLRASEVVLTNLLRLRELSAIETSLADLERMANESRYTPPD